MSNSIDFSPAIAAYRAGASLQKAGSLVGYCPEGFRKVLKRLNIPVRNPQESISRRYTLQEDYFRIIDSPEKAWLLGFIATDGLIRTEGQWCLTFGVSRTDRSILVRIAESLGSNAPIRDTQVKDSKSRTCLASFVSFHSVQMVQNLLALGLTPAKSFTVKPPVILPQLENSFWLGAFDGDGGLHPKEGGGYGIHFCGNWNMVSRFADFIHLLTGYKRKPRPQASIFQIHYNRTAHVQAVLRAMYQDSPIYLERKRLLALKELERTPNRKDWTWITVDYLRAMLLAHGSWPAVAAAIGNTEAGLAAIRSRLGMPMGSRYH